MSVSKAIGNTPLIKISEKIYAKLESSNPSGSVKDRMAAYILDQAEKCGQIKAGQVIVEATSGNTGIAFSMLAAERGYTMIVVMPENMSIERKQMIRSFGAQIVEVGTSDFPGACVKRDELVKEWGAFCPDQFRNRNNIECHEKMTSPEIVRQLEEAGLSSRDICAFVAGTGTGGTLMGVGKGLRRTAEGMKVVAVEPVESAVMLGGEPGVHTIQGIGDGFIPEIVDMSFVDEVVAVSSQEAIERCRRLTTELGLFVGISSGANVRAAEIFLDKYHPNGFIVTILPDSQNRYMSLMT